MPAPLTPLIGFALGVLFAWWAREELARSPSAAGIGSRSLAIVTLFATVVFAPVGAYFLAFEADWSYAYFIDTRRIPSALQLALVLLDAVSVPVGFAVAASYAKSRKLIPLLTLAMPAVGTVLVSVAVTAGRLGIQASYAQFHGDFGTRPVAGSSLGYALLWMDTLLLLGVVWTSRQVQKLSPRNLRG
ncbi:MAG TPA: hypothetical protein VJT73_06850 [Polyangiaceae bacterium]|nr:hypothetical protein [Polyangiaceae bacterium]